MITAVKFLKTLTKLCSRYEDCSGCPIRENAGIGACSRWIRTNPEEADKVVEKWLIENHKLNIQMFKEIFGIFPVEFDTKDGTVYGVPKEWWFDSYDEPPTD